MSDLTAEHALEMALATADRRDEAMVPKVIASLLWNGFQIVPIPDQDAATCPCWERLRSPAVRAEMELSVQQMHESLERVTRTWRAEQAQREAAQLVAAVESVLRALDLDPLDLDVRAKVAEALTLR